MEDETIWICWGNGDWWRMDQGKIGQFDWRLMGCYPLIQSSFSAWNYRIGCFPSPFHSTPNPTIPTPIAMISTPSPAFLSFPSRAALYSLPEQIKGFWAVQPFGDRLSPFVLRPLMGAIGFWAKDGGGQCWRGTSSSASSRLRRSPIWGIGCCAPSPETLSIWKLGAQ